MENRLRNYFPLIRERKEVLKEIGESSGLQALFRSWTPERQEEFLDFCTGMKGVKILYDSFFKEIMSPEYTPGRLNHFLSLLLGKKVVIRQVLPNEGGRIADENTLLVTDILVEFEDGSLADVEIQKLGYAFPGERSACYAADLLLRKFVRSRRIKSGPIFITRRGNPLDRSNIWRKMKSLCDAAGVSRSKVFPHSLRHLFAKCFYSVSKDISRLADVLGHSSINTTRIYVMSSDTEHMKILERLHLAEGQ